MTAVSRAKSLIFASAVCPDVGEATQASLPKCWPLSLTNSILVFFPTIYLTLRLQGQPQEVLALLRNPVTWLAYVAMIVVSMSISIALIARIANVANQEDGSYGAAMSKGFRLFPRTFFAALLFGLVITGGMLLLIVPGIILIVSLMLFVPLIVIENAGMRESLLRSRKLVKGNWWRTTIIFTIALLVAYVLLFCVQFGAGILVGLGKMDAVTSNIAVTSFSSLLNIFLVPLYSTVIVGIYFDLKRRKEGDDLSERVAALDNT